MVALLSGNVPGCLQYLLTRRIFFSLPAIVTQMNLPGVDNDWMGKMCSVMLITVLFLVGFWDPSWIQ